MLDILFCFVFYVTSGTDIARFSKYSTSSSYSLTDLTLLCLNDSFCSISCLHSESCKNLNIICPYNNNCTLKCVKMNSCNNITIYNYNSLNITCISSETNNFSCNNVSIYSKNRHNLNILCLDDHFQSYKCPFNIEIHEMKTPNLRLNYTKSSHKNTQNHRKLLSLTPSISTTIFPTVSPSKSKESSNSKVVPFPLWWIYLIVSIIVIIFFICPIILLLYLKHLKTKQKEGRKLGEAIKRKSKQKTLEKQLNKFKNSIHIYFSTKHTTPKKPSSTNDPRKNNENNMNSDDEKRDHLSPIETRPRIETNFNIFSYFRKNKKEKEINNNIKNNKQINIVKIQTPSPPPRKRKVKKEEEIKKSNNNNNNIVYSNGDISPVSPVSFISELDNSDIRNEGSFSHSNRSLKKARLNTKGGLSIDENYNNFNEEEKAESPRIEEFETLGNSTSNVILKDITDLKHNIKHGRQRSTKIKRNNSKINEFSIDSKTIISPKIRNRDSSSLLKLHQKALINVNSNTKSDIITPISPESRNSNSKSNNYYEKYIVNNKEILVKKTKLSDVNENENGSLIDTPINSPNFDNKFDSNFTVVISEMNNSSNINNNNINEFSSNSSDDNHLFGLQNDENGGYETNTNTITNRYKGSSSEDSMNNGEKGN